MHDLHSLNKIFISILKLNMKHIAQFMKRYIILILSFLTSSCWLMAQPYIIKRLGIEQGLSNNYVVGITQDKQGFYGLPPKKG